MVLDYRRLAKAGRGPRRSRAAGDEPQNEQAAVLAMQASAGNRATRAALADVTAQRAVGGRQLARRSEGAGGLLTFDGVQPFSVQSASWSQDAKVATQATGSARHGELIPGAAKPGEIVIKLAVGRDGPERLLDLVRASFETGVDYEHATLRLDQRSTDGKLPASSIELSDVYVASAQLSRDDDPPTVTVVLSVGALSAAGLGKDPDTGAVGKAEISGAVRGWTPVTMLDWKREPASNEVAPSPPGSPGLPSKITDASPTFTKIRATVAAGPNLKRLSEAMAKGGRLQMVYTPKDGGRVLELREVLVERMAGSSRNPAEIDVVFIAERVRVR